MPDLSKRPSRYATAAVALALVAGYTATTADVQVGASSTAASLQAENDRLAEQLAAAQAQLDASRTELASATAPVKGVVTGLETSLPTCAAYGTQEEAQAVFDSAPAVYAAWDGNGNGAACEQLRSEEPEIRTVTVTAAAPAAAPAAAVRTSTAPPAQQDLPAPSTAPTAPSKAEILASRNHFGLYAGTVEEYDAVEASTAKDTTLHGYFGGFDTDYRAANVTSAWSRGEIPFLTWESRSLNADRYYSLDDIAAGTYDEYLQRYAQDVVATGLPLAIRFDQEMNGNWYRWGETNTSAGNSAGSYARAWRHVHDVFEAAGANELVIWVWSPNRVDNIGNRPAIDRYWPGAEYVDWVGMTGYYRTASQAPTFAATYTATLAELRRVAPGKPIILSEVGATETGGKKVAWVQDFFTGLRAQPDVIGFVWFNYTISENGTTNDWRLTSSTAVTDAFRAGIYATGYGRDRGKAPVLDTSPAPVP